MKILVLNGSPKRDNSDTMHITRAFAGKFGARLTVSENSMHPFLEPEDAPVVEGWLRKEI